MPPKTYEAIDHLEAFEPIAMPLTRATFPEDEEPINVG